jgi:hypothetical protein
MVKHQHQSHQKLIRSEFDEDESLSEAQHLRRMMQPKHIPQHSVILDKRQVPSSADFAHVPEQNNPHIATFNTDIPPTQSPPHQSSQNLQSSPASLAQLSQTLSLMEQQLMACQQQMQQMRHALAQAVCPPDWRTHQGI